MKTWHVVAGSRIEGLAMGEETPARPGPSQVRVRMLGSGGAGEVIEVGSAVTRLKVGDRVLPGTEAPEAFGHMAAGKHFGKVALSFA